MKNIFVLGPHMGANKYNPPNTLNFVGSTHREKPTH